MKLKPKDKVKTLVRTLILSCLVLFLGVSHGLARIAKTFPELSKVESLTVKNGRIFVIEGPTVSIYSLGDYHLIKKFGTMGEGPREFRVDSPDNVLRIDILPGYIVVNSIRKVSYYTLDGEFVKEKAAPFNAKYFQPLGENYVGELKILEGDITYKIFNLFNPVFEKIKEVSRQKHIVQKAKNKFVVGKEVTKCQVFNDKIFISGKEGFAFDIYDKNGNLFRTFKQPYEKRKLTNEDQKEIHELLKKEYGMDNYEIFKSWIEFAPDFPVIGDFLSDGQYVYVSTNKEKEGKMELFMFDAEGKFLKNIFLPVAKKDPFRPFPYDFYKGKLYQLIENQETEMWQLHINPVTGS